MVKGQSFLDIMIMIEQGISSIEVNLQILFHFCVQNIFMNQQEAIWRRKLLPKMRMLIAGVNMDRS